MFFTPKYGSMYFLRTRTSFKKKKKKRTRTSSQVTTTQLSSSGVLTLTQQYDLIKRPYSNVVNQLNDVLYDNSGFHLEKGQVLQQTQNLFIGKLKNANQTVTIRSEIGLFVLSSNPYVPLDSGNRHGAQTIYEYLEWQSNYHDRIATEKIDADIRKEEKKRLKA